MEELVSAIVEKCGDYRCDDGFSFDKEHVVKWIEQFPEAQREDVLACISQALSVSYFSRAEAESWLDKNLINEEFVGDDPEAFWRNANFLVIQERGRSQREMLAIMDTVIQKRFGFSVSDCGSENGAHIYLDDGLFSGGHINNDLKSWIEETAPQKADLRVLTVAMYTYGEWYSKKKLSEAIKASGKKINMTHWCSLRLQNGPARKDTADVLWPKSIPEATEHYFGTFSHSIKLRSGSKESENLVFDDDAVRDTCERAFLEKGVWIRDQETGLNEYQRPLGNSLLETPGFGATFVTFRNCPNNAPLVFWASEPWYPLFPRKTNSDTALLTEFEALWE